MSVYLVYEADMKSVADTIRAKTGSNEELAFPEGFNEAADEIYETGKSDGVQSEYDRFWDAYQDNGERKSYTYAFAGFGWAEDTFKPKYDIDASGYGAGMFYNAQIRGSLAEILDTCGITLDTGKCTNVTSLFHNAMYITELGVVDVSGATAGGNVFGNMISLRRIEKIVLPINSIVYNNWFVQDSKLSSVRFEGRFLTSIDFKDCPLDVDSMLDIINNLENFNGTSNYQKYTLKFSDACWATLDTLGPVSPNGNLWSEYVLDLGWLT